MVFIDRSTKKKTFMKYFENIFVPAKIKLFRYVDFLFVLFMNPRTGTLMRRTWTTLTSSPRPSSSSSPSPFHRNTIK